MFDLADSAYGSPLVTETEVVGQYMAGLAVAASRATACDPGSGPMRIDD